MNIANLTGDECAEAANLFANLAARKRALDALIGEPNGVVLVQEPVFGKRQHWSQTPQGRARLAASARRRWRKARRAKG